MQYFYKVTLHKKLSFEAFFVELNSKFHVK